MLTCFELTFLGLGMILGLLRSCEALVNEGSLRSVHPYPGFHSLDGLCMYLKHIYEGSLRCGPSVSGLSF